MVLRFSHASAQPDRCSGLRSVSQVTRRLLDSGANDVMWWVLVLCSWCSCGGGLSAGEGRAAKSPPICESTLRYQGLIQDFWRCFLSNYSQFYHLNSDWLKKFHVRIYTDLALGHVWVCNWHSRLFLVASMSLRNWSALTLPISYNVSAISSYTTDLLSLS